MFSIFEALNVSCKLTVHFKEMLNFNYGRFWDVLSKLGALSHLFLPNRECGVQKKEERNMIFV